MLCVVRSSTAMSCPTIDVSSGRGCHSGLIYQFFCDVIAPDLRAPKDAHERLRFMIGGGTASKAPLRPIISFSASGHPRCYRHGREASPRIFHKNGRLLEVADVFLPGKRPTNVIVRRHLHAIILWGLEPYLGQATVSLPRVAAKPARHHLVGGKMVSPPAGGLSHSRLSCRMSERFFSCWMYSLEISWRRPPTHWAPDCLSGWRSLIFSEFRRVFHFSVGFVGHSK
ncbi:hypothetical protein GGQ65_005435 [Rhizobium fabae]|uniref:Uncharacterized protein n=1 Tax=Rhizobium fabae TaxID=573179 RepID=A0A7W6BFK0_9HYPH|nr:hypothetical protein [Rhizobium fabae]